MNLLNPWALLAVAGAWLASLIGVGLWQRTDGAAVERAAWEQRDNDAMRRAQARIAELQDEARAAERASSERLAVVSARYQEEMKNARDQANRDVAAARAGALRLRDPGAAPDRACPGEAGPATAAAGGRDGQARGDLSAEAAGFLLDLANEADDVVRQLGACQEVVRGDRREFSGSDRP